MMKNRKTIPPTNSVLSSFLLRFPSVLPIFQAIDRSLNSGELRQRIWVVTRRSTGSHLSTFLPSGSPRRRR
ncbi:Os07g0236300 [Oryza sativa Japonica Group]|uniref:Os07g0236300 protein n=1 Tax=Oryza sativa subsp. japonica TaxID=39947 RepID=A0A0P0X3Y1_ORYSJ|nr:hypothetical protein EE612_038077 [Oryza sativa]BAT00744.1 Os07g0236300 [Oryza sativa Japonica Group]